jgi:hypothetical protein
MPEMNCKLPVWNHMITYVAAVFNAWSLEGGILAFQGGPTLAPRSRP